MLQDLILLFKFPMVTRKDFFEICRGLGHAPSKSLPSPGLDHITDENEKSSLRINITPKLFPLPSLHPSHANCNTKFLGTFIIGLRKNFPRSPCVVDFYCPFCVTKEDIRWC
jgi:hypothetical protein